MWPLIKPKAKHLILLAVFLPLFVLALYFVAKNTDAYAEADRFVAEDVRVAASIGPVQKTDFKFWKGFEFTGSKANFSIEATTEKGKFIVDVGLHVVAGAWRVKAADVYGRDNAVVRIAVSAGSG